MIYGIFIYIPVVKRNHGDPFQCKVRGNYAISNLYISSSEKAMAPHSNTLAWKIPWMEESGGLRSMGH